MGTIAVNSLSCVFRLALVVLVVEAVLGSEQDTSGTSEHHGLAQLTITDADTQSRIDLYKLLKESSRTGDTFSSIPKKVQLDVEPVAKYGVFSLILQRVPPFISDDFEAIGDSSRQTAQSTRNTLMYCFYSGYLHSDQIASERTYVHAQLCPEFVVTVSIYQRGISDAAAAQENSSRISLTKLSPDGVNVEWGYQSTTLPKVAPRFGDFKAVSDKFVHVSDSTQLRKTPVSNSLTEKQAQFDNRLRRSFEFEAASNLAQTLRRRRREIGKSDFLQHIDLQTSRFIELYAIVDSGAYGVMRRGGAQDITEMQRRVGEIVSMTNAMMSSVNIWVVLVGIEIWSSTSNHQFSYNYTNETGGSTVLDGTATITQLGQYRVDKLLPKRPVDHVHLFTTQPLPGGYAALALIDEFCFWKSATVSSLAVLIAGSA